MKRWTSGHTFAAGITLIALTNAVALGGVWWNRLAPPESTLTLSERELGLPWRSVRLQENSGLALNLRWRVVTPESGGEFVASFNGGTPEWLDGEHLQALGFAVGDLQSDAGRRHFTRQLPREAVFVLELDGPARQQALARARANAERHAAAASVNPGSKEFANRAKAAQNALASEESANSRLFVIDAGPDAVQLRQKYPDRTRFMLLKGSVRPTLRDRRGGNQQPTGLITHLAAASLNVPHALHAALEGIQPSTGVERPAENHFSAVVQVGGRLEPWISKLESMSNFDK
jgi:hypothetical protein